MKSVLITGGAGFVGQHLVKRLLSNSSQLGRYRVTIVDNLSNSKLRSILELKGLASSNTSGFSFYKEDIRNKKAIFDILKNRRIDTCIHLAAKINVPYSIRNPAETLDVNITGMLNILEACSHCKVRNFIFASTAAVYGKPIKLPLAEHNTTDPISPYGASKVAGEALVSCYQNLRRIENALCLRFFNIYGQGQSAAYAGVITRFAKRLSKGLAPIIYGDGKQTRDFVSANDVVNSILLAIETKRDEKNSKMLSGVRHSCILNIGTGIPTTINDLAKKMIRIYGVDTEPIYCKEKNEGDIKHSYADMTRTKRILKFKAKDELEHTLKRILKP